ncbi:hypothetical protein HYT23_05910 [Candidatus Pacearchaeota archaeon]|nr:hypothetical protein [Candidatus Pacearchaeota archaeon]
MSLEFDKARLMSILARGKSNWGAKYDRLEHFKRFQNLDEIVKDLAKLGWLLFYKKFGYKAISLNPRYKSEIISFIETQMPYLKGIIK